MLCAWIFGVEDEVIIHVGLCYVNSLGCLSSLVAHTQAFHVQTSVGRFSFFCENQTVPILTLCYENLINFLIYFFLLVKTDQVITFFKFFKFIQFSNRAVLAYIIKVDSHIQFSQPGCRIFHKLEFNLMIKFL
jgi:hypothetical protein